MESLADLQLIKFHPNTMTYLRKQYNLDKPGQMDEAIDLLDGWIRKQNHFTVKEFPRNYLERQIILDKGSVERAKRQIEKSFTLKTLLPQFFTVYDVKKEYAALKDVYKHSLLPILTEDHYRIYVGKATNSFNSHNLKVLYQIGICLFEYVRANDYCNGFIIVLDYTEMNIMDFIAVINLVEMRQFITLLTEAYQVRLKAIHIVTASKAVELVVKIYKQIFSAKIGNRIQVQMNLESLYQHVPKELLPKDMGGDQNSLASLNDDLHDAMSTKEFKEYLKEISKARVDEKPVKCESDSLTEASVPTLDCMCLSAETPYLRIDLRNLFTLLEVRNPKNGDVVTAIIRKNLWE